MHAKTSTADIGAGAQPGIEAVVQGVERLVEGWLDALYQQAEEAVAHCQASLTEAAQGKHPSEVGRIGVRVRRQTSLAATPGSFTIEWVRWNYAHTLDGRKCHTKYIPRGEGDRYPHSAYRGIARRWQMPVIAQAEDVFADIRRRVRLVAGVRTQLRAAIRAVESP